MSEPFELLEWGFLPMVIETDMGRYHLSTDLREDIARRANCLLNERGTHCVNGPKKENYLMEPNTEALLIGSRPIKIEEPDGCNKCDAAKLLARDWNFCPECGKDLRGS